jgi:hypothetical protein
MSFWDFLDPPGSTPRGREVDGKLSGKLRIRMLLAPNFPTSWISGPSGSTPRGREVDGKLSGKLRIRMLLAPNFPTSGISGPSGLNPPRTGS